ncbi:MAG: Competence protein ComEC [Candidatus Gottesmanbacteria bacterium GW2011_GWB1_49_7]|uniref:Competence protein ComEC n=1 Tax=Candidatus Gottesmanbacteria bacterium GW2011_GWB1_49_7 TaxID=1618448 RepID=A0A0G1VTZ0_9BACT|nr:MAG: Competence protein ComEC [Candidatus Gottesmanbacteria bacterium GW2011_GWB1_49_7]
MYKILALAAASIWLAVLALPDNKLHLVVCDVGQGDAILVSYKTTQMLVDGGPNGSVLKCLGDHMPFYDHRIELVLLTHPQADHMNGLIDVLKRYTVLQFVKGPVSNDTQGYGELMQEIRNQKIETRSIYTGDVIQFPISLAQLSHFQFQVLWPERGFESEELNDTAIVGKLSFGDFTALLTSDAGSIAPPEAAEVLKVPHHGSKYGMTREWLEAVRPRLAIISVGKRNSYGHPTPEAIKLLSDEDTKILRTDQDGDVEIVSDGKAYWIKK